MNGIVYHITDKRPEGDEVFCTLDFDERFEKMQCHTAEHILCGIIHRLFGLENVGFHLGDDEVIFDISAPLSREDLDRVEALANEAVFENIEIETLFPSAEELPSIEYRAKLDITENVRIVKIGEVDSCACCAPHVAKTGEIGIIKILDFMKHRGGLRISMTAGRRALADYRIKYSNLKEISAILSVPQHSTAEALVRYTEEVKNLKYELKQARCELALAKASSVQETEGNLVALLEGFSMDDLRAFTNAATPKVSGMLVALSGKDGDYKFVIASESVDLSLEMKKIKEALTATGGGKCRMVQGSFSEPLDKIKEYFR
jgi:alanyl-tRNA synthetase